MDCVLWLLIVFFDVVWTCFVYFVVFFFKQKTAYEMLRSLVGSEMCIRDRTVTGATGRDEDLLLFAPSSLGETTAGAWSLYFDAVSYTHLTLPTIYSV